MKRLTVCVRKRPNRLDGLGSWGIGKPGMTDPRTGKPFVDDEYDQWQTSQPCCESCGEMIGTSRRRYGRNRWPATVTAYRCEDCGCQVCSECYYLQRTDEVVGTRKRTTEGGYRYDVPDYRERVLCRACRDKRNAEPKPERESAGKKLLKELGLWDD